MPFDFTGQMGPLERTALASLRAYFDRQNHRPSDVHWEALRDIARTIQAMADGSAAKNVYLSSCDPGVGKSQTAVHMLRALVAEPSYDPVGVIVCVGKLIEAESLATALLLPEGKLAVVTSDATVNQTGTTGKHSTVIQERTDIASAQVLIVTQQRIEKTIGDGSFEGAHAFWYRGRPRQVRIWDEAWLPGAAIVLTQYELTTPISALATRSRAMADAVTSLFLTVKEAEDGALISIPDWEHEFGLDQHSALAAVDRLGDQASKTITSLYLLGGHIARVRQDGKYGASALTYRDTLPSDLGPLLVLDASGRIRQTYSDVEQYRGGLEKLATAAKDYSPLTVNVWYRGGGKSAWKEHAAELIEGVVSTILRKPAEDWLIVHHKAEYGIPDVRREVTRQLPSSLAARVSFVQWGSHQASNDWCDVGNVILAGTLFFRPSQYTALTQMAQDKPVETHRVSDEDVAATALGEHRHQLLQAIGRGRVRKLEGDRCPPMEAFVIADARSGIPGCLGDVFPGCTVRRWTPIKVELTGKLREAVDYLDQVLKVGIPEIPEATIRKAVGLSAGNWSNRVGDQDAWRDALEARGVVRDKDGRSYVLRLQGPWVIVNPDATELAETAGGPGVSPEAE